MGPSEPLSPWLNYHHLHYFWLAAKEGTVTQAARKLRLSPPTVGAQIHALEEALGQKLFEKRGRLLQLTEAGKVAFEHADAIFARGRALVASLREGTASETTPLAVGVEDGLSKWVTYRLLEPVLTPPKVSLLCTEDTPRVLLQQLVQRKLDVVLAAAPADARFKDQVFNHRLGGSTLSVFATSVQARALAMGFPRSLNGAPMVLPTPESPTRKALDRWLLEEDIQPHVVAQVQDSALLKVMGQAGVGAFIAPTVLRTQVESHHGVLAVGELEAVTESYFAITGERRIRHPALSLITKQARRLGGPLS